MKALSLVLALVAALVFTGCDPYADRDVDEDVCNESCLDDDYTVLDCVCGRLITHSVNGELVTECMCSCNNPEWETTWEWCANPW
ncbi:MAG: hypothetical protein WC683_20450 [bacterium]